MGGRATGLEAAAGAAKHLKMAQAIAGMLHRPELRRNSRDALTQESP